MILTKVPIQENGERIIFSTRKAEIMEWLYAKNNLIFTSHHIEKLTWGKSASWQYELFPFSFPFEVKLLSRVWLFTIPWTIAYQAPPSMEFSRQEYCSGLPFPSPGDLPDSRIKPKSPTLQADNLPSKPQIGYPWKKPLHSRTSERPIHVCAWKWVDWNRRRPRSEGSGGGASSGRGGYGREGRSWFTGDQRRRRLKAVSGWVALVTSCSH